MARIGLLHPGQMGAAVGHDLVRVGHEVVWVGRGRSEATRRRADEACLTEAGSLGELGEGCEVIVSLCPPEFSEEVAGEVARVGFEGLYVEANAIAPSRASRIEQLLSEAGVTVVDGSVVGPPVRAGATMMFLSGDPAGEAAALWVGADLEVRVLDGPVGSASALKMAYAAWSKGTSALLLAIVSAAEAAGVGDPLAELWGRGQPDLLRRSRQVTGAPVARAWRWGPEMAEVAEFMAAQGVPDGFHRAAAEVYERLAGHRDDAEVDPEVVRAEVRGEPGVRQ